MVYRPAQQSPRQGTLCSRIPIDHFLQMATLLIFGVTVILLIVFWVKNRKLEQFWREKMSAEKEQQLRASVFDNSTLSYALDPTSG